MAEEVGQECREFLSQNVSHYDDLSKDDAKAALVHAFRKHAFAKGWDDVDFHVNSEQLAIDEIEKHRGG